MFVLRPTRMPAIFGRLSYVVVDELHAFIGSVRGAQLQSQLYRLRARCNSDPVRVGLSATLAQPELACQWLRPDGAPATLIDPDSPSSDLKLRVRGFWRDSPDADVQSESEEDASVVEVSRAILQSCKGHTNLVFANAKRRIEQLADELKTQAAVLGVRDEIVVHHGSLSREQCEYAEQRLKTGEPCTAVCTNTLELGIDIGAIDCVVQVMHPGPLRRSCSASAAVAVGPGSHAYFADFSWQIERPRNRFLGSPAARLHPSARGHRVDVSKGDRATESRPKPTFDYGPPAPLDGS